MDEAVTAGMILAASGDPLLVVYEKMEPVLPALGRSGAHSHARA